MSFVIVEAPQRSQEWFRARLGRLTGSVASDMLSTIKSAEAAARRDLRTQLVVERLTGQPCEDGYTNGAMQWGIDHEAEAFAAYEAQTGSVVRRTGFLAHTDLMAGVSLDGDVDDFTGIVEVKCPKMATHLGYLEQPGKVPSAHVAQITHALWLTGAQWCDFVSFDPRFPPALQMFLVRVLRDEAAIASYALAVSLFLSEVQAKYDALCALMAAKVA